MFTISNLNEVEREGAVKGRLKYITATVKYNESDWSYGWNQHIDGLTLYVSGSFFIHAINKTAYWGRFSRHNL